MAAAKKSEEPRDAKDDVKDKPESRGSKIVRWFMQLFGKGAQTLAESGVVENEQASKGIGAAGGAVQEQAEMDPTKASATDRLKGIAGASVQAGGELADNDIVAAVAEGAADQIKADDDATIGNRIGMLAKDTTTIVADSGLVENEQALTVIKAAGDVVKEQAEMDPEKTSAGDRFKAGAGTVVEAAGKLSGDNTAAAAAKVAANQIKADDDAPIEERSAKFTGDLAKAAGDSGLLGDKVGPIATTVGKVVGDNAKDIGKMGDKDDEDKS